MSSPSVWLWILDDLIGIEPDGDEHATADRDYRWSERAYATDIVNRTHIPRPGAILAGVERTVRGGELRTLGYVESVGGVSSGRLRVTVRPLLHFTPFAVEELLVDDGALRDLKLAADSLRPQLLGPEMSAAFLDEMRTRVYEAGPWLDTIATLASSISGDRGQRLREERDALQTGLDLAGARLDQPVFRPPDSATDQITQILNPEVFVDYEDDLLFADLRRFDGSGLLEEVSASTSLYRESGFTLHIANVNRKPVEHQLGVDLLYWDQTADSYTLLQYKRLTRSPQASRTDDDEKWQYRNRADLIDQLSKMDGVGRGEPEGVVDWRIVSNPFWFKFVRTDAFDPDESRVLRGMYVPSDYLRVGIRTNEFKGAEGGFVISYANTRYLPRGPFVELVRRRMSGSTSAGTAEIQALLAALGKDRGLVVVAKNSAL